MQAVPPGGVVVFPGGWVRGQDSGHIVLYVLHKYQSKKGFSFSVINTGEGIEYHAARPDSGTAEIQRNVAFTVDDVPAERA